MKTKDDTIEINQLLGLYKASEDATAHERLVTTHLPSLVGRLCRRFSHTTEPLEDLVQVETIGLLKAIAKYDPNRGTNFAAFAVPLIIGEIKNYFRDHGWAIKVPRKIQRQRAIVEKTLGSLSQELGHSPTIQEIAKATGFSEEEVYDTFEVGNYGKPLSLDTLQNGNDSEGLPPILDTLGIEDSDLEGMVNRIDLVNALHYLDSRERNIVYLKFYGGLSQNKIAEHLGISQVHVSRLQRDAVKKLKSHLIR